MRNGVRIRRSISRVSKLEKTAPCVPSKVLQQCLGEPLDAIRTLRLNPVLTGVSVMFALTITADEWLRLWLQHDPAVLAWVDSATVGLSVTILFFSLGLLALRYRKHSADVANAAQPRRSLYAWPLVDHIRDEGGGHD